MKKQFVVNFSDPANPIAGNHKFYFDTVKEAKQCRNEAVKNGFTAVILELYVRENPPETEKLAKV